MIINMKLKLNLYINKQSNYILIKWLIKQSIEQLIEQLNNWKNDQISFWYPNSTYLFETPQDNQFLDLLRPMNHRIPFYPA